MTTPRHRFEAAADRMQRLAVVAAWLLGLIAIGCWYDAALGGHAAMAAPADLAGSAIGPVSPQRAWLVQAMLFTLAAFVAVLGVQRPGMFGPVAVGGLLAFLLTAVPWLMIQRLAVPWEVLAALPTVAMMFASTPGRLRFLLGLSLVSLLGAMVVLLQPALLAVALMIVLAALAAVGSAARLNRLGEMAADDATPTIEHSGTHAAWFAIGLAAGALAFTLALPLGDAVVMLASDWLPPRDVDANAAAGNGPGHGNHPTSDTGLTAERSNRGSDGSGGPDSIRRADGGEVATPDSLFDERKRRLAFAADLTFGDRTGGMDMDNA
ncbi:MAG: hypothetical protein AB7S36_22865, partial [Planctomycetota bacterium]